MTLPIFDSMADVPDAFKDGYEERDGKARPKVLSELELERAKRTTLLDEKKESDRKAREAAAAAAEAQRKLDAKNANIPETELERLRAEDAAKRQQELEPLKAENERLKGEVHSVKVTDRVRGLAVKHKVMGDRLDDAMVFLMQRAQLGDKDGIVWKDKAGAITTQTDEQFFAEFKKERPWLFPYEGGSGSGGGKSGTSNDTTQQPKTGEGNTQKRQQVLGAL